MRNPDVEALVADLTPVRRLRPADGIGLALLATAGVVIAVAMGAGLRADLIALRPQPLVLLRSGALVLLGLATLNAVAAAARPAVGRPRSGWRWALAMTALFPAASAALLLGGETLPDEVADANLIASCLTIGLASAAAILAVLTLWLRQGAVTDRDRAGWLAGLAAGSLGVFAYSLHCPSDSIHYVAIWYGLAVAAGAGLGRIVVPRLLRW